MRALLTLVLVLVALLGYGQTVGGAGWCKTSANPNTITSLRVVNQKNMCSNVWDTLARKMYYYDYTLTVGSRWVEFIPLTPPIGAETVVTAGTGISVTGIGSSASPYVVTNTGDLSNTNEIQHVDTLRYATDSLFISLYLDGRPQKKVYIPQSPGGIYGPSDTTTGNHIATIAAGKTLTVRSQGDNSGGIVPFRIESNGSEPDITGFYANGDSLLISRSDTEFLIHSSAGITIMADGVLALQGDSILLNAVGPALSTEKTFLQITPGGFVKYTEGVSLSQTSLIAGANITFAGDTIKATGGGGADSLWVKQDGTFGGDTLDNVRRTGKIAIGTTSPKDTLSTVTIVESAEPLNLDGALKIKGRTNGDSLNFYIRMQSSAVDSTEAVIIGEINSGEISGAGDNTSFYIGKGVYPGGALIDTLKPGAFQFWEDNFINTLPLIGNVPCYEMHWGFAPIGGGQRRPITIALDHLGRTNDFGLEGDRFYINRFGYLGGFRPDNGPQWLLADFYAGTWLYPDSLRIIFQKNGIGGGGLYQGALGDTTLLSLMYADEFNRIVNGGPGVTSTYMPHGRLDLGGTGDIFNTGGAVLTLGTTSVPARIDVNAPGSDVFFLRNNAYPTRTWKHQITSDHYALTTPTGNSAFDIYDNAPNVVAALDRFGIGGVVQARLSITQPSYSVNAGWQLRDASDNAWYQHMNSGLELAWAEGVGGVARMQLAQNGKLRLNAYTSTSAFPVTAAGVLAFDASGYIGTTTADLNPSDDITGSGTSGQVAHFNGTQTITGDADWTFDGLNQALGGSIVVNGQSGNTMRLGSITADNSYPGIWMGAATPSFSNYAFLWDNGTTSLSMNAPSGGFLSGRISNGEIWRANSTGLGIGVTPTQKLDVNGTTKTVGFQMPTGAVNNYILKTDGSGNGSWVAASTLGDNWGSQVVMTTGSTLDGNGTTGSELKVNTNGITANEIAADAVGSSEIATDAVGSAEIAANAVGSSELAATAVTANSYGSTTNVATFTVDADGRLTAAANAAIAGLLSGLTANQVLYATGATTAAGSALFTWNPGTNRLSVGNTGGSPQAAIHVAEGSVASFEAFRAAATVSGNMLFTLTNANNAGGASNNILTQNVGGSSAGDPLHQYVIGGVGTWVEGVDNSDVDKFKIAYSSTPGSGADWFTITTTGQVGIQNSAPAHALDVTGRATATLYQAKSGTPTHTFGTGAGTTPTLNSLTGSSNGILLQFTTGTTPSTGANIISITYPTAFSSVSYPMPFQGNDAAATDLPNMVISAATATAFTLKAKTGFTLPASTTYIIRFNVSGQ